MEDGLATVAFADRTLYFDLNDVIKSFVVYKTTTTVYYVVEKDGTINRQLYPVVNPKTGATYNVVTVDGETQTVKTYEGTFAETGRTSLPGSRFTSSFPKRRRNTRMSRQSALRHWRVPRPVRIICSFMTRNMKGASLLQIPRTGFEAGRIRLCCRNLYRR